MATWTTKYSTWVNLIVTATESDVNVSNNTSKVTVTVQLKSTSNTSTNVYNGYSQSVTAKVNNSTIGTKNFTYNISALSTYTLGTWSTTVTHNSDGSMTVPIYVHASGGGDSGTINQSLRLTTIPRAAGISVKRLSDLATISSANYGEKVRISISSPSSSFTYTIRAGWNGKEETLWSKISWTQGDWTIPAGYMSRIPNSTSSWGTLYVDTYSGSTKIGTKSTTLTTNVPSNIRPTIDSISVAELTSGITAVVGTGNYVQTRSKPRVTVNGASGTYSSTIKQYNFSFDGKNYTNAGNIKDLDTINGTGTLPLKVTVTDSRGRVSAEKSLNVTVLPYASPRLSSFSVSRKSSPKTTLRASFNGSVSALKVGTAQKNSMTVKIYSRLKGEAWAERYSGSWTAESSVNTSVDLTGTHSEASSYEIRFVLSDKFSSTEQYASVATASVPLSWSKTGVGIGKIWEQGALDIGGTVYANGKQIINTEGNFYVHDTRSEDTPTDLGERGVTFEFKNNSTDGLNDGGTHHGVMTFQQWGDSTGGTIHQLGFGYNTLWLRTATIGSSWGAWKPLANSERDNIFNKQSTFNALAKFNGSVDIHGKFYMDNNTAIYGKDASGSNRRMLVKGADNHVHINPDAHGSTFIHTSTLPNTPVYLGTRDYRWLQFNVKGNAKNPSASSPGSGSSIGMFGSNSIFEMGIGAGTNEREGWLQVRHADTAYANAYGQIKLQPLGGSVYIGGSLSVAGSKNAIHVTRDGVRATPAYETAESYLGDLGSDNTGENSRAVIPIETLFGDIVNTSIEYQVFLQAYGNGRVWVAERNLDNFVVMSDVPNIEFGWEIKAKRRGYENDRLELQDYTNEDIKNSEGLTGGYSVLYAELDGEKTEEEAVDTEVPETEETVGEIVPDTEEPVEEVIVDLEQPLELEE